MRTLIKIILLLVLLTGISYAGYRGYLYYQAFQAKNQAVWSFLVIGDNEGINPAFDEFITAAKKSNAKLLIHTGDLSSGGQREELIQVKNLLTSLPFKYYPVLGNNDAGPANAYNTQNYQEVFGSELYSSFDFQNSHFILLDNSNRKVGFSDAELAWLAQDLENAKSSAHIFIFMHRPFALPLAAITGDDETKTSRTSNAKFVELINKYKIDHIFTGHLHNYFTYDLGGVETTISGGGGAVPQSLLGGTASAYYHYLEVTIDGADVNIEVKKL